MLVKVYGVTPEGQRRYSAAVCTVAHKYRVEGNPDPEHVGTSFVEHSNLSIPMGNGRMTRFTNALSKKAENRAHMMVIYFCTTISCANAENYLPDGERGHG